MYKLMLIFVGSGLGGLLRYGIAGWTQRTADGSFPVGTLVVNVLGCLFIGFVFSATAGGWLIREEHRVALTVGLLGGFTTFSTFGVETFALLADGQYLRATANVTLSVLVGLTAVWIGSRLAQGLFGA